jgi:hypothetical protein
MPFAPVHVALYIDADNQASQNARALVLLLRDGFGASIVRATVAGNGNGKVTAGWVDVLREEIPDLPITEITVPCRKDAADAALIMALGADLADHLRVGTRVVVSRDTLLHAAAERVQASGGAVCLAYADCEIPTPRHPSLVTLLLPALTGRAAPSQRPPAAAAVPSVEPSAGTADLVARVRALCKLQPGGGYLATDVGNALSSLGYKSVAERRAIVAGFPGLKEKGGHPTKVLVF